MTKKIVAAVISAVFLIGSGIFGFLYPGLSVNIPKVESKVKIKEPEQLREYLNNIPGVNDYYLGKVENGKFNGNAFHNLTISVHMCSNEHHDQEWQDEKDRRIMQASYYNQEGNWTISLGSEAMYCECVFFGVEGKGIRKESNDPDEEEEEEVGEKENAVEIDYFIKKNVFCYRIRKYNLKEVLLPPQEEYKKNADVDEIKKSIQTHMNEWISVAYFDVDSYKALDSDHLDCELTSIMVGCGWIGLLPSYAQNVQEMIDYFVANPQKCSRKGDVITWKNTERETDFKEESYRIDLSGGVPHFEVGKIFSSNDSGSSSDEFYNFYGFDTTTVKDVTKTTDSYAVFYEYVKAKKERKENG